MCQVSSTMRRMTTMGSSVLGLLKGWRPVSSTYANTPSPHLQSPFSSDCSGTYHTKCYYNKLYLPSAARTPAHPAPT